MMKLVCNRSTLLAAALTFAIAGCRESTRQVDPAKSVRSSGSDIANPVLADTPKPPIEARRRPRALQLAAYEGGAIALDVQSGGGRVQLVATRLNSKGFATELSWIIADVTEVPDGGLAIDAGKEVAWVGWIDRERASEEFVSRAAELPLRRPGTPITPVEISRYRYNSETNEILVRMLEDGRAAIATTSASKQVKCVNPDVEPGGRCTAPGYEVVLVSSAGTVKRLRHDALDGGNLDIEALVDLGGTLAVAASAWHGGPETNQSTIPYAPKPPRGFAIGIGWPPRELFFMGDQLITYSESDYCPSDQHGECPHLWVSAPKQKLAQLDVDTDLVVCSEGRPWREFTHARGRVRVPLEGWTGEALLAIEEGSVRAKICQGQTLVDAP